MICNNADTLHNALYFQISAERNVGMTRGFHKSTFKLMLSKHAVTVTTLYYTGVYML
jgi:hypothetical protein